MIVEGMMMMMMMMMKGRMNFEVAASMKIAHFANKTIDLVENRMIAKVEHRMTMKTSVLASILDSIVIVSMSFVQDVVNMRMSFVVVGNKRIVERIVVVVNKKRSLNFDIVGGMIAGTSWFEFESLDQNNLKITLENVKNS